MSHAHRRQGFALVAVLWILTGATVLAAACMAVGRDAFAASRNRVASDEAMWQAESCLSLARAAIDHVLSQQPRTAPVGALWTQVDRLSLASAPLLGANCDVRFEAAGSALNVNTATPDQLHALFAALGLPNDEALIDALLDWRDGDSVPRPEGAEADWYRQQQRPEPRNGPLADIRELRLVRGYEDLDLDGVLGVEPGRISLNTAPEPVLASLPGITQTAADRIIELRNAGQPVTDLAAFAATLPSSDRDSLDYHFQDISRAATLEPDAWIIQAIGRAGRPLVKHTVEARLSRVVDHAAIVRRREW